MSYLILTYLTKYIRDGEGGGGVEFRSLPCIMMAVFPRINFKIEMEWMNSYSRNLTTAAV